MRKVNVAEAKAQLSHLIDAALEGEEIVLARRGAPLVRLAPIPKTHKGTRLGGLRGRGRLAPDFDAPLDDFDPYAG